ncbi:Protein phosphatase methylesterase 1 [Neophaeococcomyces mojaviensis]|uniref:Protein phosphatase methylesterase 1 n=1 Tax=Neophaeococcomyces mojaviensis TaxID=3383035 RepID=A0ACC3A8Q5_9EURO|nr:Protein phosphatase methylesterase 1 [Knufia sp. JES_112]
MSALQKSFARAHLQNLPPPPLPPPVPVFDEREEEDEQDHPSLSASDSSSSASSTGTIIPSPTRNLFERPRVSKSQYDSLPWQDFFDREIYLDNGATRHHAYFSAPASLDAPLFCFHHGAGASGLSFASLTAALRSAVPEAGYLSPDCRGHGETQTPENQTLDLSLATLATDLAFVINATHVQMGWQRLPPIILLGHSLGGAVVTEVAYRKLLGNAILGYGVFDVVEGSAMDALQSMESYLSSRPRSFQSVASGIEWHVRSRTIRNTTSARVSVPPLLVQNQLEDSPATWLWRTDLSATKPFWENWFTGLSSKFLSVPGAGKLLLLAGTDRLDKELMIGQMQGKYQLQVFPDAGHFVHEDQPEKTAMIVADFWRRNDRSTLVLPPKVDDLIKQGKLKPANQKK